ncbi:4a-hydroxytetrahydrobiopterin dehydratase [Silvibacterium sp.]|uniref:4a-hydroxytetrahydrobiopterin dehydratase n=1 Tax=Silvibacterium sp. TaxID=1964179 RepID=UPI0039E2F1DE
MPLFSSEQIQARLKSLPEWKLEDGVIVREFEFGDFALAISFVNAVAEQAEQAGHHPDIDIRYNRVRLALTSHDAGGLTNRDFDLADAINAL